MVILLLFAVALEAAALPVLLESPALGLPAHLGAAWLFGVGLGRSARPARMRRFLREFGFVWCALLSYAGMLAALATLAGARLRVEEADGPDPEPAFVPDGPGLHLLDPEGRVERLARLLDRGDVGALRRLRDLTADPTAPGRLRYQAVFAVQEIERRLSDRAKRFRAWADHLAAHRAERPEGRALIESLREEAERAWEQAAADMVAAGLGDRVGERRAPARPADRGRPGERP